MFQQSLVPLKASQALASWSAALSLASCSQATSPIQRGSLPISTNLPASPVYSATWSPSRWSLPFGPASQLPLRDLHLGLSLQVLGSLNEKSGSCPSWHLELPQFSSCWVICLTFPCAWLLFFTIPDLSLPLGPLLNLYSISQTYHLQQQKSFIVHLKMDSELNSFAHNSPVFTPWCKDCPLTQFWDTNGQGDRPSRYSKLLPLPLFFALLHLSPLRAACTQVFFFWILLGLTTAVPAGPNNIFPQQWHKVLLVFQLRYRQQLQGKVYQLTTLSKGHKASTELISLQRKGAMSFLHLLSFIRPCTARTASFNIGITTLSCLAYQPRKRKHIFFEDWLH